MAAWHPTLSLRFEEGAVGTSKGGGKGLAELCDALTAAAVQPLQSGWLPRDMASWLAGCKGNRANDL